MKRSLRHSVLIGFASLLSIIVIGLLVLALTRLNVLDESPAMFLSTERTIALFHKPTAEQAQRVIQWFPELAYVKIEDAEAIAIVALPGGGRGSITFRLAPPGTQGNNVRGPYSLDFSDSILLPGTEEEASLLSNDSVYRAFARRADRLDSWIYIRKEAFPIATDFRSRILSALLYRNAPAIALRTGSGNSMQIDRYVPDHKDGKPLSQNPLVFPGTFVAIAYSNLSNALEQLVSTLPDDEQIIFESIERSLLENYAGKAISWEFDSTFLLSGETFLYVRPQGNALEYVLIGSADSRSALVEKLEHLHTSFRSILPTSRTQERTFDDRFPSKIVESSEEQIVEEESVVGPWTVHVMRHSTQEKIFITATSGDHFALSNTAAFLEEVLQRKGQPMPLPTSVDAVSAGSMDLSAVNGRMERLIPRSKIELLPQTFTGTLFWSLSQDGPLESLWLAPAHAQ